MVKGTVCFIRTRNPALLLLQQNHRAWFPFHHSSHLLSVERAEGHRLIREREGDISLLVIRGHWCAKAVNRGLHQKRSVDRYNTLIGLLFGLIYLCATVLRCIHSCRNYVRIRHEKGTLAALTYFRAMRSQWRPCKSGAAGIWLG